MNSTRDDEYPGAGVTVRYLINEHLSADLNYIYSKRSSNAAGVDFTDNMVEFGAQPAHLMSVS